MKFFVVTCVLLLSSGIYAEVQDTNSGFSKCLEKDSISCLQLTLFRQAKSFFDNPEIEVLGGVSLKKENEGRQGKSLEDNSIAIESAPTIEARSQEMGTYFLNNAKNFFQERSLSLNFANVARSISKAMPDDIKTDIKDLIVEGRTKKRRVLKKLLPLLLGVGAKLAVLAVGSIFGLLLLAKKALVISVIAFVLAVFAGLSGLGRGAASAVGGAGGAGGLLGGLGGLFGGGGAKQNNVGGGGSSGWSSGGNGGAGWSSSGSGGWDSHGAYSSPVAQSIAYSGYKQARR